MFRKITLLMGGLSLLVASGVGYAQEFEIETNPVEATTVGVTPYDPSDPSGHDFVAMDLMVKNISTSDITLTWRNISDSTEAPEDWLLVGVCDNIQCRAEFGPWYYGTPQTANPIAPGVTMDPPMAVHIYAPNDKPDGTGIYKIELSVHGQIDTAVFILTKDATGLSTIKLDDNRVSIYPNPIAAGTNMNVFINKELKASHAMVYNIIGQRVMALPVSKDKELNNYNISSLAPGMYMLRLTDYNGQVITTRKFSKQ